MRAKILETSTFQNLDSLQQKITSGKTTVNRISHFYEVARNRGVEYMRSSQHPTKTEYLIVKELLTK